MSKRIIVFEETIKYQHEFVIDENTSDEEIDDVLDEIADSDAENIDDIYDIMRNNLGEKLIELNRNDYKSGEIDNIEFFDDYIKK